MKRPTLVPALAAALLLVAGIARGAPEPVNPAAAAPAPTEPAPVAPAPAASTAPAAPAAPETAPPADPPIQNDEKRAVPDYDGREEPTTAGDVLIWVPRVLLSPLYLVSEFVIRRPLGALVTWAEEKHIPDKVVDALTFGEDRQGGIAPTGVVDFGFRASIGVYFFYNGWIPQNDLRIRAATGLMDLEWLSLNVRNRYNLKLDERIVMGGFFLRRPDWIFHGLGPESPDTRYRFSATTLQADLGYENRLWRRSNFTSFVGVRSTTFDPDTSCCGNDSVATGIARGDLIEPPGLDDGYALLRAGIDLDFDTRHLREPRPPEEHTDFKPQPGSGVRLNLRGELSGGLDQRRVFSGGSRQRYAFVRYGASLTGFWDLTGEQRVLSLTGIVDFADPLRDDGEIPFSEQITLGGARPMRGFLAGRLIDRSAAVARLIYSWPVWVWLDGLIGYELGNVFGEHLSGFDLERTRSSYGIGLRGNASEDHVFEILLAFGTETIEDGMGIEHTRFVFGATSGF